MGNEKVIDIRRQRLKILTNELNIIQQPAEKVIFVRLLKYAQMQGARNPVVGAIHELPLRVRRNKPAPCLTRGRMRATTQMGVFQQPANPLLEKYQTYGKIVKD
jgi:hypothetical protein